MLLFGIASLLIIWTFHPCPYICRFQDIGRQTNRVQLCVFCMTLHIFHSHSSTLSFLAPCFFSNISLVLLSLILCSMSIAYPTLPRLQAQQRLAKAPTGPKRHSIFCAILTEICFDLYLH